MTPDENYYWELAASLTQDPRVSQSTMMGLPCLRWDGRFFASLDRRNGDLIIKLAKARVTELVAAGLASPFAPAGRRFREWAAISAEQQSLWADRLREAQKFASTSTTG
jgi:hypothetical protein